MTRPTPGAGAHRGVTGTGRSAAAIGTIRESVGVREGRSFVEMDQPAPPTPAAPPEPTSTVAEDLPELYRAILERVAVLERIGARAEAGRIRAEATRAYSNAWDDAARRLLLGLLARAERRAETPARTRVWSLRRRSAAAR